ncbi:ribonuclease H [Microvirga sp. GCM10011540]|uniref:ribonuclease H family protein n=1 Tax=Microvirga sp. GCM10011540 TaxID=3317338 RepID=UPI0036139B7E
MIHGTEERAVVYTDGACMGRGRLRPGGYAAIILLGSREDIITGRSLATTNTAMELMGVVEALEALPPSIPVEIYSDSHYVIMGATKHLPWWRSRGWRIVKGGKVANKDLWQRLSLHLSGRSVTWNWVKGHSGDLHNERAHALAYQEAQGAARGILRDPGKNDRIPGMGVSGVE